LWAQGVASHAGLDVSIREPDVSPLQLQGPRSGDIMAALFGESIRELKYYWLKHCDLDGIPLVISRTGWSSELGYEIYLCDGQQGSALWEKIMAAGEPLGLRPGHTSTIRRVEGGMLSYHADMTAENNPFELGLDRLVDLDMEANFIGKAALRRIQQAGVTQRQVGLILDGAALLGPNTAYWPLRSQGQIVGQITSAVYSPRLKQNIALAMLDADYSALGTQLEADLSSEVRAVTVVEKPFFDPKKAIAASTLPV
jgi:aminomethyltransferase